MRNSPFLSLVNGHWSLANGKNPWLTGSFKLNRTVLFF